MNDATTETWWCSAMAGKSIIDGVVWMMALCERPLYGFAGGSEPLQFAQPEGHKDIFFLKDKELEFDEVRQPLLPMRRALCPRENLSPLPLFPFARFPSLLLG
eukprot:6168985-Pyramimonas_sp.AAC.1